MNNLSSTAWMTVAGLGASVVSLVVGYFVLPRIMKGVKSLGPWLTLALAVAACCVAVAVLSRKYPSASLPDEALPRLFLDAYWGWVLAFLLIAVGSIFLLARTFWGRRGTTSEDDSAASWPELEEVWDEILVRLGQAKINPAFQKFYLLIAPDEDRAAALIRSAGLHVYVEAPEGPSPVHAYATSDAVFLTCSGASDLGATGEQRPGSRMEALCRKLRTLQPDCPVVRGVAVLFPVEWAGRQESVKMAAAVRDDLQAIRRALQVRCPVFALFPGMEAVPGFPEFAARLAAQVSPEMLDQRAGFAVPSSEPFSGDLVQRGLVWVSGWFHDWILHLLASGSLNDPSNGPLVTLDYEIRRYRKRLRAVVESAFSTHRENEPVLLRGCYVMASGDRRADRAFAAGLFRGAQSRIVADHVATSWNDDATREDRYYRRLALAVGLVGGGLALVTWLYIASKSPLFGGVGLLGLTLAWVVVLLRFGREQG